jgi:hypothetical protein
MANINAFIGVANGVAGMSRTLHAAEAAAAHPAFWTHAAKRRTATATGQSVDWGTT